MIEGYYENGQLMDRANDWHIIFDAPSTFFCRPLWSRRYFFTQATRKAHFIVHRPNIC